MLSDTSPEAKRAQIAAQRALGGARRFQTACRMCQTFRDSAKARIRALHPDFDEQTVLEELAFELYRVRRNS